MAWAEELLAELGRRAELDLKFSDHGTSSVLFGKDEVFFELRDERLFIIADLGASIGLEHSFKELLEACNLGSHTAFGALGIDAVRQEFVLTRILTGSLTYDEFEQLLSQFVRTLRYWKRKLEKLSEEVVVQERSRNLLHDIMP